ncbi:hypothetical protein [Streptomyces sp. NPDC047706]|uniref:hypothetical protein n=1 Tax=Streptomyces sp. NPDC047706 TaxID=3365486 RepID=UPI0037156C89
MAPGERVEAGAGVELWLTGEGKHWSTPEMDHQFQTVGDADAEPRQPHVGLRTELLGDGYFLSGMYQGTDDAARVVVDTSDGKVTASAVRLAGKPGWGVWFTEVQAHDNFAVKSVTVYDEQGEEVASMTPARP